ncbi:MAG: sulfurtransferase [Candidatus Nitrosothermus koennekii]|nr:MAG: sulfurtransferase [Candidatus Nitrosothermus koennekii]
MTLKRKAPILITPSQLLRKKNILIIDARREEDYKKGHIPNAISLPLAKILSAKDANELAEIFRKAGVGDDTHVVVYDDIFGALAARVAWTLEYLGHEKVSLLSVTFSKWKELGYKVEKRVRKPKPAKKFTVKINKDILATYDYVQSVLKESDNKVLLDSRERLNYLDTHIPRATNIPWRAFGDENSILKPPEELRRMLENRKIKEDKEIITYCGSVGTLSGLAYYALKYAGYDNVKLYAKSLKEWKALQLPTEGFKEANYWDLSAE